VRHDSEIESLDALKDKKINLGPLGSGGRATMHDIMRAKGWSDIDFKSLSAIPNDAQVPSLCGGQIDAIVMATGHPNALIADISKTCAVRMLSINDPIVDKFISGNPEIGYTIIKGGMYTGIPNDVKTFGTRAILVTTSDASDEMVYNIVKAVNANFTAFKSLHPVLAELSDKSMGENPQIAPYHPGAARYFAEHAAK
jgi:TRAP transporter TAXI family solute receptor